jgi:23S rRNA (guanosine2251-2'-O)-methyltransferase
MSPRKPFRPNKNRPPFRGGTRDGGKPRENTRFRGDAEPVGGTPLEDPRSHRPRHGKASHPGGSYWIYGNHAVLAAIDNPNRRIRRLVQSSPAGQKLAQGGGDRPLPPWETVDRQILDQIAGRDAVHQGVAALVEPLPDFEIEDLLAAATDRPSAILVVLDQVTDPHNVGAILRSAAAFGALAVLLTERHAAPETGVLAKAASGALDVTPLVRVANLARAMEQLKTAGFWCVGLAGEADRTLAQANLTGRVALCLGAEGPGLRRLTREHCDLLAKLPTSSPIGHLNVSNAAAVALYELVRAGTH